MDGNGPIACDDEMTRVACENGDNGGCGNGGNGGSGYVVYQLSTVIFLLVHTLVQRDLHNIKHD